MASHKDNIASKIKLADLYSRAFPLNPGLSAITVF